MHVDDQRREKLQLAVRNFSTAPARLDCRYPCNFKSHHGPPNRSSRHRGDRNVADRWFTNSQKPASKSGPIPARPTQLPARRHDVRLRDRSPARRRRGVPHSRALGEELAARHAARTAGVTRMVALSAINADASSPPPSRFRGDRNKEVDQLAGVGLEWVSLRPTVSPQLRRHWAPQSGLVTWSAAPYASASPR